VIRYILMILVLAIAVMGIPRLPQADCWDHSVAKNCAGENERSFQGEPAEGAKHTNADGTFEEPAEEVAIPILCYHRFDDTCSSTYAVTPTAFEDQMEYLRRNGFHSISLKTLSDYVSGSLDALPPRPVVITIDDGWKSAYTKAAPILKEKGFTATFFVYTYFISSCRNSLSWDDLKVLLKDGFEVGSHTKSHPNFLLLRKRLDPDEYRKRVLEELKDSRKLLEEKLKTSVSLFSYPYGLYDSHLENEIRECGYKVAVTTNPCPNSRGSNRLRLSRFTVLQEYTLGDFSRIVTSRVLLTEAQIPKDSSRIKDHRPLISAKIVDEDVDRSSLRMRLGETVLGATFNPTTGKFSHQITKDLKERAHLVTISARDKATRKLKLTSWLFIVETPPEKR